jgi:hypothetical protein
MTARSRPQPAWLRARRRPPVRCGACGWQAPGHSPGCASRYYAVTTAEGIYWSRVALMLWMDLARHHLGVQTAAAAYSIALSGRARELGLEQDQAGDFDRFPAVAGLRSVRQ